MNMDVPLSKDFESDFVETIRIADELKHESDRGVVLVVAAFLDEQLEMLLTRHFIDDPKVAAELLSSGSGPLGTFSSRMKLAYCLDLIHPQQYKDLQTIRKLRNEFAHSHIRVSFESDRIRDLCANLGFMDLVPNLAAQADFSLVFDNPKTTRNQFIAHAVALFCGLTLRIGMSAAGQIDAIRFIERDMKSTGGAYFQQLIDEMENE
jgi:DNA-binding MltR family transcriptional regulator